MKHSILTLASMAVISLAAGSALAGHHEDGEMKTNKGGWFQKVDTDGDGNISREEFNAKQSEKFNKMDSNGDGLISKDELKKSKESMKEKVKEMKEKYQKNKDDASDDEE